MAVAVWDLNNCKHFIKNKGKVKIKISLLQAVEAHRVARG
jgi:hypothetical protein